MIRKFAGVLVFIGAMVSLVQARSEQSFGGKFGKHPKVRLADLMANYGQYGGKLVIFEGHPRKVCKKTGCWMVVQEGGSQVRTLFKDYGFSVPPGILGKKVRLQGRMEKKKISAATRRHYMKDEGKKLEDIKKVKEGQMTFQFIADAVEII